jgi:hypothetical protein
MGRCVGVKKVKTGWLLTRSSAAMDKRNVNRVGWNEHAWAIDSKLVSSSLICTGSGQGGGIHVQEMAGKRRQLTNLFPLSAQSQFGLI